MASIAFNDGSAATLSNGLTGYTARFANWTPMPEPDASRKVSLTGVTHQWAYRTDYGASFDLPYIPAASLDLVDRLVRHLYGGGSCTVTTGDTASNVYTCTLFPESTPSLVLADRRMMEYTLALKLRNSSSAVMECLYG